VKATVLVRPKPGILDPQGEAIESSLRQLGFSVAGARTEIERMCQQLLANPLIESYEIEIQA
jgi:phosphoribosylformylglycinamidine synthase subunit PurS